MKFWIDVKGSCTNEQVWGLKTYFQGSKISLRSTFTEQLSSILNLKYKWVWAIP